MAIYAFGAAGTNNVGDEAIFAGLQQEYPTAIQVYVNKPISGVGVAVWYADILEERLKFAPGDLLIIGGGGLLHCKQAVLDYIRVATLAVLAGAHVELQGIGAEAVTDEYRDDVRYLCTLCSAITVRSYKSRDILQPLTTLDVIVREDFAKLLPLPTTAPQKAKGQRIIGVAVAGGENLAALQELIVLLQERSVSYPYYSFRLIPHSRAYVQPKNNDVAVNEYIWSSCDVYHANRETRIQLVPFTADPYEVLRTYSPLDAVICYRYHSLVFSSMFNIPALIAAPTEKMLSFITLNTTQHILVREEGVPLLQSFDKLMETIQEG